MTLFWLLPSPLLRQAMLKVPAMILGVKGALNQHCIAGGGECANLRGFCESAPRLLARIVALYHLRFVNFQFTLSYHRTVSQLFSFGSREKRLKGSG